MLLPGETLVHRSRVHWLMFLPRIALLATLVLCTATRPATHVIGWALVTLLVGGGLCLSAFLYWLSTEMVVTDRRVLLRKGIFGRTDTELQLNQVESIQFRRGVLGWLFNFGAVTVVGSGGTKARFDWVTYPDVFRDAVARSRGY